MNQAIHFKTSMFDVSKEKENPINPIYGISLLEWLREELKGELSITKPDAEDWGWYSELQYGGNTYLIGSCAHVEEGEEAVGELEWVFQVDRSRSFMEILLGKNKMTASDSCFVFFKELFENNQNFKEVQIA